MKERHRHCACLLPLSVFGLLLLVPLLILGCFSISEPVYSPALFVDIDPERMDLISYPEDIQPLFNSRCVVCHSCFDAPAQLKLDCADGVERGATKQVVYETRRKQARHTRLHLDAQSEEEWREKGFFSVLADPEATTVEERLASSLIYRMLSLSRLRRLPEQGLLDGIVRDSHDKAFAPTIEEFPSYAYQFPHAGMPFYTYGLSEDEFLTFAHWIAKGSPVVKEAELLSVQQQQAVDEWELLLNGDTAKDQLIARYLYEHWFAASLHFSDLPDKAFFRLVRSRTPPGEPIDLIATGRPNDDPGVDRVYYRFIKRHGVIMRKTHLPYALNPRKMQRLWGQFWESDWNVTVVPPYGKKWKERPFEVFKDIPERSRYQFMLDDSYYFIQSFIRGPVCRGQTALNVIRDHFFVMFTDPDFDPACADPEFLDEASKGLVLPSSISSTGGLVFKYPAVKSRLQRYQALRTDVLTDMYPEGRERGLSSIWQGEGSEGEPFMTVFRHFDTASVVPGLVGATPPSAWLVDYSLFERVYYVLVANFDVYGSTHHQLATRLYFDMLRYEGETSFLGLIPSEKRVDIFQSWYRGVSYNRRQSAYPLPDYISPTGIDYSDDTDPRQQLRNLLEENRRAAALQRGTVQQALAETYREVPDSLDPFVQYLPEVLFLRIRKKTGEDEVYTVIRNKAHKNVAFLFNEESRREPEKDSLLLVRGLIGDYPNMMMVLDEDQLDEFRQRLHAADSLDKVLHVYLSYGTMRNSRDFWPTLDWFVQWQKENDPIGAGQFDLKHYYLTRLLSLGEADLASNRD